MYLEIFPRLASLFSKPFFIKKFSIKFDTAICDIVVTLINTDSEVIVPPDPTKISMLL